MEINKKELARAALDSRKYAYVPYSGYQVGAALLCQDGTVYTGCNIENSSYSVCVCGERTALFKAVSEGKRQFAALAVCGGSQGTEPPFQQLASPCGVCRQAFNEFEPEMLVLLVRDEDTYEEYKMKDLLPLGFTGENMG